MKQLTPAAIRSSNTSSTSPQESTWETVNNQNQFEIDRFGRVTKITSADTTLAPTVLRYLGDRRIDGLVGFGNVVAEGFADLME